MNNNLISREELIKTIKTELDYASATGFCRKMNNIKSIDLACKILSIIDNAPTIEYPFYAEAYQTGYEEAKNERPLYKGVLFVDDYGINKVIEVDENGTATAEIIIPRDTFIEAYNKFIRENDDEHTDNP